MLSMPGLRGFGYEPTGARKTAGSNALRFVFLGSHLPVSSRQTDAAASPNPSGWVRSMSVIVASTRDPLSLDVRPAPALCRWGLIS